MKKILSILILLACIASNTFALSAKIMQNTSYRHIKVYDNRTEVLIYSRPLVNSYMYRGSLGKLYKISWYKEGATVEQIKEWKEFAKLFAEEE